MKLYVMSYNRAETRLARTLRAWPKDLGVDVVVRPEQVEAYGNLIQRLELPKAVIVAIGKVGVPATRQAILEHHLANEDDPFHCQLDDDLSFLTRNGPDHEKPLYLHESSAEDIKQMFDTLEDTLESGYAHCGISGREGNNRVVEDSKDVARSHRILAYDASVLEQHELRFRTLIEDMDMTLQLLRLGYSNRVFYRWAQGQVTSAWEGGLSDQRTAATLEEGAKDLEGLHPGFVKAVQKTTKTSWGGGTRWDVNVRWKKAYEEGLTVAASA